MVAAEKVIFARQMGRNSEMIERRAMCAVRKWCCRREGIMAEKGDVYEGIRILSRGLVGEWARRV